MKLHIIVATVPALMMKGDTPLNSTMSVGQARKLREQLKTDVSIYRIKVSKAAADMIAYCDAHACEDPLVIPVSTSENPFRKQKFFCALLWDIVMPDKCTHLKTHHQTDAEAKNKHEYSKVINMDGQTHT